MTVAQYGTTDFTSQTGTAYKTQIDANSLASKRIAGRFAPHAQSTPNMTIRLDAGSIFDGVTLTEVAAQSTSTITAPTSYPRIDRVVIDNVTGAVSVVTGTQATSPVAPAIPNGKSPVAQVLLQTSTTSITNIIITDERNFSSLSVGGFGAQTTIGSAATCDLGSVLSRNARITGTTTITSFGSSANTQNPIYLVEFAGALTLTNGAALLLPGGVNIATAAGDTALAEYLGSGNWRVRDYTRVDGTPIIALGTAAFHDVGTSANQVVQLDGSGRLPAVDGSQLTNVPSGALVALSTQDASGSASLVFTGIDGTYDEYRFEFHGIIPSTGTAVLYMQVSTDGGSTYLSTSGYTSTSILAEAGAVTTPTVSSAYVGSSQFTAADGATNSTANQYPGSVGTLKLFDVNSTKYKIVTLTSRGFENSSRVWMTERFGTANTTSAINAVKFYMSSGNIASGRITMYGLKHA